MAHVGGGLGQGGQNLQIALGNENAAARAISYFPRDPGNLTFKDSDAWVTAYADKDTTFIRNGAYRLDARALFLCGYICVSPWIDQSWKPSEIELVK